MYLTRIIKFKSMYTHYIWDAFQTLIHNYTKGAYIQALIDNS